MAVSRASAVWEGDLVGGSGRVSVASGAFPEQPVTWAARTERPDPKTSPEELISAAHAACYAMALSTRSRGAGHAPERLSVDAVTHFTPLEGGGVGITRIDLAVARPGGGSRPGRVRAARRRGRTGLPGLKRAARQRGDPREGYAGGLIVVTVADPARLNTGPKITPRKDDTMFLRKPKAIPDASDALPGRDQPIELTEPHTRARHAAPAAVPRGNRAHRGRDGLLLGRRADLLADARRVHDRRRLRRRVDAESDLPRGLLGHDRPHRGGARRI